MRTALLVLNFGGPQRAGEVEPFLYELLRDPDVVPLPGSPYINDVFGEVIAIRRWPTTAKQYAQIGGGSPLVPMTLKQAEALKDLLAADGAPVDLYVGMRYTRPTIRAALQAIQADGPARIVALPLYPQYSFATTGSTFKAVSEQLKALRMDGKTFPVSWVPAFPDDPDYVAAIADTIREAVATLPAGVAPHLLFSAHGLPLLFVEKGDPYPRHVRATVDAVLKDLAWTGPSSLAWQSKVGPRKWLTPPTETELRRLGAEGAPAVVVIPVSFVGDHIETLFELDIEYKEIAEEAGIHHWRRTAAMDLRPRFIRSLATQVRRALAGEGPGDKGGCCLLPRPPGMTGLRVVAGTCGACRCPG